MCLNYWVLPRIENGNDLYHMGMLAIVNDILPGQRAFSDILLFMDQWEYGGRRRNEATNFFKPIKKIIGNRYAPMIK